MPQAQQQQRHTSRWQGLPTAFHPARARATATRSGACSKNLNCGSLVPPGCHQAVAPSRSWGGIGNMLPVYAQVAAEAFANNCTPYLSDGGRDFVCTRKIEPTRASRPPYAAAAARRSSSAISTRQSSFQSGGPHAQGSLRRRASGPRSFCLAPSERSRTARRTKLRGAWGACTSVSELPSGGPANRAPA